MVQSNGGSLGSQLATFVHGRKLEKPGCTNFEPARPSAVNFMHAKMVQQFFFVDNSKSDAS
jgi:hypothetical protein